MTPNHDKWLSTNTGKVIDLLDPDPEQISLTDIAHNLSKICRFNGQIKQFYSVAQHSMYVAALVPPRLKLQALLHDASEAYICDVPTPFKRMLGDVYKDVETRVQIAIGEKLGCDLSELHPAVKIADRIMLVTERDFLQQNPRTWGPEYEDVIRYPGFNPNVPNMYSVAQSFIAKYAEYRKLGE